MERAAAAVSDYAKALPKRKPLWSQSTTPGTPANLETVTLAMGDYLLRATITGSDGKILAEATQPIALGPQPRADGIYFGARGPAPTNAYRLEDYLLELQRLNLQGLEMEAPAPVFADALLRHGFTFVPHFDPRKYLTEKRIDKDGKEAPNPWAGGKPGLVGIAGAQAPANARKGMEERARQVAGFPSLRNVFTTSDDFSALAGPDYCAANLEAFKRRMGLDAPRAPTAKPGLIPDDDPWLQWLTFLSRDVLGGFNDGIRRGLDAGSPGARVWPVPGGAQWPLFNTYSAQYPPFNFGKAGFNLMGYYCYLSYWAPTPTYLYWSEVARLVLRGTTTRAETSPRRGTGTGKVLHRRPAARRTVCPADGGKPGADAAPSLPAGDGRPRRAFHEVEHRAVDAG